MLRMFFGVRKYSLRKARMTQRITNARMMPYCSRKATIAIERDWVRVVEMAFTG
jgi:hypothetical protein